MASDLVTLVLEGDATLDDLASALSSLRSLLGSLADARQPAAGVTWLLDGLDKSSAIATFRGSARDGQLVESITSAYLEVGREVARGRLQYLDKSVLGATSTLVGLLGPRIPSIRFETADDDVTLTGIAPHDPELHPSPRLDPLGAYGAVLGRVQTLTNRGSLRFTLYDILHDRAVSCYLQDGQQDLMRDAWDQIALVKGWVKRDPRTGRPLSVRRVRGVESRPEGQRGSWRAAEGVLAGTQPDRSDVAIRQLRDAQ